MVIQNKAQHSKPVTVKTNSLSNILRWSACMIGLLCAGCTIPNQNSVFNIGTIKRVYCSANSIGFDFHFDRRTGETYSYNKKTDSLVRFNLGDEIPFASFIPKYQYNDLYSYLEMVRFKTEISDNAFVFTMSPAEPIYVNGFISLTLNLDSLEIDLDAEAPDSPIPIAVIEPIINDQISCEYITPESTNL